VDNRFPFSGVKPTSHLYLETRLRIIGAIHPPLRSASWLEQGQLQLHPLHYRIYCGSFYVKPVPAAARSEA